MPEILFLAKSIAGGLEKSIFSLQKKKKKRIIKQGLTFRILTSLESEDLLLHMTVDKTY